MNATRRELADDPLDETTPYPRPSTSPSDSDRPTEPPARTTHRYTFESGARPLDGYTVKRGVGRGGFGEVYYAVSDAGKEVALKLILRNLEIEERGVRHCMNLKSPNLITIFDLRTNDFGTFVIMEYVSGPSLAQILTEHPQGIPLPEVRAWMKGLVDGVSYLHDHGIVHRDLKPANLFLEEGVVKIGDYGLSKSVASSNEGAMSENVGTCHYMAPEISRGKYHKPIDIYAMGVILYEMLTGKLPFEGETAQEILWKHLTDQPELAKLPEPYRSIVRHALAKNPDHRPQRPQDLLAEGDSPRVEDIRFLERQPSSPTFPAGPPPTPPTPPRPEPAPRPAEDILVIGHEEPVMYIGPDTQPPRPAPVRPEPRYRRAWQARRQARARRREAAFHAAPVVSPTPTPRVPPLPSPRVRVAELAGSMLGAAPLASLAAGLVFPLSIAIGAEEQPDPLQLMFLFLMILLGTWSILIPTKLWEGRVVSISTRRMIQLGVGLALGLAGFFLIEWARLTPSPVFERPDYLVTISGWDLPFEAASTTLAAYFGIIYAASGWWKLTARDRSARFRIWPLIKVAVLAGLVGFAFPWLEPWGAMVVVLVALITQLVSPWNADAAAIAAGRPAPRRAA